MPQEYSIHIPEGTVQNKFVLHEGADGSKLQQQSDGDRRSSVNCSYLAWHSTIGYRHCPSRMHSDSSIHTLWFIPRYHAKTCQWGRDAAAYRPNARRRQSTHAAARCQLFWICRFHCMYFRKPACKYFVVLIHCFFNIAIEAGEDGQQGKGNAYAKERTHGYLVCCIWKISILVI